MCTVTFIPRPTGYLLAMNRDESRRRPVGLLPRLLRKDGHHLLGPQELGGGSWFRVNEHGMAFTLVNWYGVPERQVKRRISRGKLLNQVATASRVSETTQLVQAIRLKRVLPFRLVVFDRRTQTIIEQRWDQAQLSAHSHPWALLQWASSGYDEPAAQTARLHELTRRLRLASTGTLAWLRRLHRSHRPERGALSTCMHREEARTVSYTELSVTPTLATMRHVNDSPCKTISTRDLSIATIRLPLR